MRWPELFYKNKPLAQQPAGVPSPVTPPRTLAELEARKQAAELTAAERALREKEASERAAAQPRVALKPTTLTPTPASATPAVPITAAPPIQIGPRLMTTQANRMPQRSESVTPPSPNEEVSSPTPTPPTADTPSAGSKELPKALPVVSRPVTPVPPPPKLPTAPPSVANPTTIPAAMIEADTRSAPGVRPVNPAIRSVVLPSRRAAQLAEEAAKLSGVSGGSPIPPPDTVLIGKTVPAETLLPKSPHVPPAAITSKIILPPRTSHASAIASKTQQILTVKPVPAASRPAPALTPEPASELSSPASFAPMPSPLIESPTLTPSELPAKPDENPAPPVVAAVSGSTHHAPAGRRRARLADVARFVPRRELEASAIIPPAFPIPGEPGKISDTPASELHSETAPAAPAEKFEDVVPEVIVSVNEPAAIVIDKPVETEVPLLPVVPPVTESVESAPPQALAVIPSVPSESSQDHPPESADIPNLMELPSPAVPADLHPLPVPIEPPLSIEALETPVTLPASSELLHPTVEPSPNPSILEPLLQASTPSVPPSLAETADAALPSTDGKSQTTPLVRERREFLLANGERIMGQVLSESTTDFYVFNDSLGILTIGKHQIARHLIEVILINGDRLVGDVVAETAESLYLGHASLGTLTIPRDQRSTRVVEALMKEGDRIVGEVVSENDQFTVIRSATLGTISIPHQAVEMLNRKVEQIRVKSLPAGS